MTIELWIWEEEVVVGILSPKKNNEFKIRKHE